MIALDRNKSTVFMGSMNAMPMAYAHALVRLGYPCVYFVDVPRTETLCRPESFFPDISYPYPPWVLEFILPSQLLVALFPRVFATLFVWRMRIAGVAPPKCFVLNGYFVAMGPYLPAGCHTVALSHGSDLDVWANVPHADPLYDSIRTRSIFRYLPERIGRWILKRVVQRQFRGFSDADSVVYFPPKFSKNGDSVIAHLQDLGTDYVPRYDISFDVLAGRSRPRKSHDGVFRIFSGVRFTFKTFPDGDPQVGKGNDIIIAGLAMYYHQFNKRIQIDFVEKGEDLVLAKSLCEAAGLNPVVRWRKPMPFHELVDLYNMADVCFDQLGTHWIGQGMYSMALGIPLIANASAAVSSGYWPADNPICQATTADQVCEWLVRLQNAEFREQVSEQSRLFARSHFDAQSTLQHIFKLDLVG